MQFIPTSVTGVMFTESESEPGMFYRLTRVGTYRPDCTCKGWFYRQRCKHTAAAVASFPPIPPAPVYSRPPVFSRMKRVA